MIHLAHRADTILLAAGWSGDGALFATVASAASPGKETLQVFDAVTGARLWGGRPTAGVSYGGLIWRGRDLIVSAEVAGRRASGPAGWQLRTYRDGREGDVAVEPLDVGALMHVEPLAADDRGVVLGVTCRLADDDDEPPTELQFLPTGAPPRWRRAVEGSSIGAPIRGARLHDQELLVAVMGVGYARFSAADGAPLSSHKVAGLLAIDWQPGRDEVLVGTSRGELQLRRASTGKNLPGWQAAWPDAHDAKLVAGVAWAGDGIAAFSAADGALRRVDAQGHVSDWLSVARQGYKAVQRVRLLPSPDRRRLAICGYAPAVIADWPAEEDAAAAPPR